MTISSRFVILPLACFTLVACSRDPGPGTVVVKYRLGNDKTCADVGVEDIRAFLGDGGDTDGLDVTAPCAEEEEVSLMDVPAGMYPLTVEGLDAAGVAIMDNLKDGPAALEVLGDGATFTTPVQALSNAPSTLQVQWRLGMDGFSNCAAEGISTLRIEAYDVGGTEVLLSTDLPCLTEPDAGSQYRSIADPDRSIDGAVFGEVGVDALDSAGVEIGSRMIFTFTPPGPGYPIRLSLTCDAMGCTGSGVPD